MRLFRHLVFTLALLGLICPMVARAETPEADIQVPEGFVLQRLEATDGLIARPRDWFYASGGTPTGWRWIIAAEDPRKGPYETGLSIQLLTKIRTGTGQTPEAFARKFLRQKQQGSESVRDCAVNDLGQFKRQCLEVIESSQGKRFHILYSAFWADGLDMVAVTTFGAPEALWADAAPIADVMAAFRLIGPNFGKN